jgi:uncharacterized protein YkwD
MNKVVFNADSLGMTRRAARLLALVAPLLSALSLGAPAGANVTDRSGPMRSLETGILGAINNLRREHGLVPLRLSSKLSLAASQHSTEMAARGYFSHSSADGSHFDRRIAGFYPMGSRRYWSVGENLLWSSPDVDAPGALQMWLHSPEHRKNMLTSRWRELGISAVHTASAPGTFSGREVTIVTADFGVRR